MAKKYLVDIKFGDNCSKSFNISENAEFARSELGVSTGGKISEPAQNHGVDHLMGNF
jgi:hypothetical protein